MPTEEDNELLELCYQHLSSLFRSIYTSDDSNLEEDIQFLNQNCQYHEDESKNGLYWAFQNNNPLTLVVELYKPENKKIFDILFEKLENTPKKDTLKIKYDFYLIKISKDINLVKEQVNKLLNHEYDNNNNYEFIKFSISRLCIIYQDFDLYDQASGYIKE